MGRCVKILAGALAVILLIGVIPAMGAPGGLVIIEGGESGYVIVRGAGAGPSEITAAEKLQYYLERVSGCVLPIVTDEEPARGQEIIVGKTNRENEFRGVDRDELGDDGFVICTEGTNILIAGGEKRGTLYGVFDFLEKSIGCRWLSPEVTIVPEMATVRIPWEIGEYEVPAYLYRSPQIIPVPADAVDYALANRMNGHSTAAVMGEAYGGVLDYQLGNIAMLIMTEEIYNEHPDWFAVNEKGERVFGEYGSPCMSNEEVIQFYIGYALERADQDCIGMSHNDTALSCQCAGCRAIYKEEGTLGKAGESGATLVRMLNRVSDALDKVGSQAMFGILAYAATMAPPQKTKLTGRAMIYFAPIGTCYAHPFELDHYKGTADHRAQLEGWVAAAENFIQWDYPCNYDHWNLPYPLWGVLQPNIQYFYENGFIGWFNCGDAASYDSSFFMMNAWLYGKLLWDPYRDMEALYEDFLPQYYGEGWEYVREYIRVTSEEFTGRKVWGRVRHFDRADGPGKKGILYMKRDEVKYVDSLWEKAKAAATEEWQLVNLRRAELSYRIWKADTLRGEFAFFSRRTENNRRLLADVWQLDLALHGFTHEYVTMEESERLGAYRLTPRYWSWRQLGYGTREKAKGFMGLVWGWWFG